MTIFSALLALGMIVTGLATERIVARYLGDQLDAQLTSSAPAVAQQRLTSGSDDTQQLPSDFVVIARTADGREFQLATPQTAARFGTPVIPAAEGSGMPDDAAPAIGVPFTAAGRGGDHSTTWRVVAYPFRAGFESGTAYVALPLSGIETTARFLGRSLAGVGILIVLVGATVAWYLIRRETKPLRQIEATAAAIAAGDYTLRVPDAPTTTEVGSLSASLNEMLTQIEGAFAVRTESEATMRRFVSDASHELRTPLATIRGYGELYRMGALAEPEQVDQTMARIEDSARRLGVLVGDLLSLARLDEGRPLRCDLVDLASLAAEAAQDLHALDPARTVSVIGLDSALDGAAAAPASLPVSADGDKLRQVLTNLVGNVARYTPAGSPAEIALGVVTNTDPSDGARVVVEVRDHGPGVTPEQSERIFERFYKADSARTRAAGEASGSGLGLAIVAAIVGAHGGHVSTSPTLGGGLTVRVDLPTQSPTGGKGQATE